MKSHTPTLGLIIGNRDFFPDFLVTQARKDLLALFAEKNITPVILDEDATKLGGVETFSDANRCAELFKTHREELDGILVILPNFGDEKGVLETIKLSGLNLPILVQAYPDDLKLMNPANRRDAFCGKISVCNNFKNAGIKYTLTSEHVSHPGSESFHKDLEAFVKVCRIVKELKNCRIGAIGARPSAFNTVRFSEKILENNGISTTTIDLSEIFSKMNALNANDPRIQEKLKSITGYLPCPSGKEQKLTEMAKLGLVIDEFVAENKLDATAIQCWSSIQSTVGCNVCTQMSMMSEQLIPSACEVDIAGALSMLALQYASEAPSMLVDWNNNYGGEEDKCVLFHCGNWAKTFLPEGKISTAPILGSTLGEDNTFGALEGRTPACAVTLGRVSTDDLTGKICAYFADAELTNDPLDTFGNRAVAKVENLNDLMQYICQNGFEHHVAVTLHHNAAVLKEALGNYLGWEVHIH